MKATEHAGNLFPDGGAACLWDPVGAKADTDSRFRPDVVAGDGSPPGSLGEDIEMLDHHLPHVLGLARAQQLPHWNLRDV